MSAVARRTSAIPALAARTASPSPLISILSVTPALHDCQAERKNAPHKKQTRTKQKTKAAKDKSPERGLGAAEADDGYSARRPVTIATSGEAGGEYHN